MLTELEKYVAKVQERTGLKAQEPSIREKVPQKKETEEEQSGLLTAAMKEQLETVFAKMEKKLVLKVYPDQRSISDELQKYVEELVAMTDKLSMEIVKENNNLIDFDSGFYLFKLFSIILNCL